MRDGSGRIVKKRQASATTRFFGSTQARFAEGATRNGVSVFTAPERHRRGRFSGVGGAWNTVLERRAGPVGEFVTVPLGGSTGR